MSTRRTVVVLLMTVCAVAPVIIGVSCPPPSNPVLISIVPDNNASGQVTVPGCVQGFVCVNLANGATVPVTMALYTHNGFDPNDQFGDPPNFACCTNPNSPVACPCPCPGRDDGDCLLNRNEIFLQANLTPVNGLQTTTLAPNQSTLTRIRCGDVKTLGAAVAATPADPITAPVDRNGPIYRDEPGGVRCGQTVQFLTTDLNQTGAGTGGDALVTLIIRTQFSR